MPKLDLDSPSGKCCFACGPDNPFGLKMQPVLDGEVVRAEFTATRFHQGWDNVVHGGLVYTLLDEVTAYALLCRGVDFGVTAKSEIRFKQVAPINVPLYASAWVTKTSKRLMETSGKLTLADGTVVAEGSSLFYVWRQSKTAVLFDMDGVIVDSAQAHFSAWREVFAQRGVRLSRKEFTSLFGGRNDFIVHTVLGAELSDSEIAAIAEEKEHSFRGRAIGSLTPFPGATSLLATLKKAGFRAALVSSAPAENIRLTMGELALGGLFDCTVSGQEVMEPKPSPQIYLRTAEKLGVEPENCIVVEDSPLGIQAARSAGMRCLAVAHTHSKRRLREADKLANSLEEVDLIKLIRRF